MNDELHPVWFHLMDSSLADHNVAAPRAKQDLDMRRLADGAVVGELKDKVLAQQPCGLPRELRFIDIKEIIVYRGVGDGTWVVVDNEDLVDVRETGNTLKEYRLVYDSRKATVPRHRCLLTHPDLRVCLAALDVEIVECPSLTFNRKDPCCSTERCRKIGIKTVRYLPFLPL